MLCRVLGVSTSGYYAWRDRKPSQRARQDAALREQIVRIHEESRGTYGSPRVHAELRMGLNVRCSPKRVARLMREAGLEGVHRRRQRGITRRDLRRTPAPDLVQRRFAQKAPNRLWVADITQHRTAEGWLYMAAVIDAFSRRVVGWAMGDRPTAELTIEAVDMAISAARPARGLIHHSDHGAQYTSLAYGKTLQKAGLVGSLGTVDDALDNAVAESFFATLQTELLDRYRWSSRSVLRRGIFDHVEAFYNRRRRHSALGYLNPIDYERRWSLTITSVA